MTTSCLPAAATTTTTNAITIIIIIIIITGRQPTSLNTIRHLIIIFIIFIIFTVISASRLLMLAPVTMATARMALIRQLNTWTCVTVMGRVSTLIGGNTRSRAPEQTSLNCYNNNAHILSVEEK